LSPEKIYHVSDNQHISHFEPREAPARSGQSGRLVWAIGEQLLHNYLLPRDCPRVTYYVGPETTAADAERFFAHTTAKHIVAIESKWLPAVQTTTLYLYELPSETFTLIDDTAAYYTSRTAVTPLNMTPIANLLQTLTDRSVELRIIPSLWPLSAAVAASTLAFSIIRMRFATARA
jgi:hypothetical protein